MDKPLILSLDAHGVPHRWISWQQACFYYAKNLVAWTLGDETFTYYGGISRVTGERSSITALPSSSGWASGASALLFFASRDLAAANRRFDEFVRERAKRMQSYVVGEGDDSEARFRQIDELKYALRSVHLFAPWVRRIFIATDSPAPAWLAEHPKVRELIQAEVDKANAKYAQVEQVKKFVILDHDLSQETGELTPTLKVKRNVVNEKYAPLFDELYGQA